jgi:hypothetical protein
MVTCSANYTDITHNFCRHPSLHLEYKMCWRPSNYCSSNNFLVDYKQNLRNIVYSITSTSTIYVVLPQKGTELYLW